jgi:SAM-dependent MidA family methyltransferase
MYNHTDNLPAPDANALAHSNQLLQLIKQEIAQQKGVISFARFMELALYAPGLGYYSAGGQKFGAMGDFVTAPEISPLFARCLACQCQQVLAEVQGGDILEFGAGSGVMAADLLLELERLNCLPAHYFILEVSADLQKRQQEKLQQSIPHLFKRVVWLTSLPATPLRGIILANEVLDAMPVHRFVLENKQIKEIGVAWEDERLVDKQMESVTPPLLMAVAKLQQEVLSEVSYYSSEINLLLPGWLQSVSTILQQGLVLLIDYGFVSAEFYHPERYMGTLMCHYRHQGHTDPFWLPGLQDITAHVDFTAVAEAAHAAGFAISGYTSQAAFLLDCGLLMLAEKSVGQNLTNQLRLSQQIQKLTAPHEMGELFKVLALTKNFAQPLLGFSLQDLRRRL